MHKIKKRGFTLIELLIVIAIIAIIAAVAFVALDPLTRLRDSRDSRRWSDINTIISAIKVDQVDNGGTYLSAITSLTDGTVYMIGSATSGCDDNNSDCDTNVTNDTACVNLSGLQDEGYLGTVPIAPTATTTWTASVTGYTLMTTSSGKNVVVRACSSENTDEISITR
jgi:prepilin-type N-terminal cleavage/methylation domain-containing protein